MRRPEANALFQRAIQAEPQDSHTWFNLGNSLRDTGRPAEAVAAFRQAVNAAPWFTDGWRNLGLVHDGEAFAREAWAKAQGLLPQARHLAA